MNREHLESMRWLYDSDESYKKAVRQIMAEEVKEKRRALLKKKLRQARFQKRLRTATAPFKKLKIVHVPVKARGLAKKVVATRKRMVLVGGASLVLLVASVLGYGIYASKHTTSVGAPGANGVAGATTTAPEAPFDPVIASDKASKPEDYKFDPTKQVLSYSATIGGKKATVAQQPFPEDFIKDSTKFEAFLDSIPERETIPLSNGTAYLSVVKEKGNDKDPLAAVAGLAGNKVQYAVFINPKFLIFIRAEEPLEKQTWQDYFKYLTVN